MLWKKGMTLNSFLIRISFFVPSCFVCVYVGNIFSRRKQNNKKKTQISVLNALNIIFRLELFLS